MPSIIQSSYHEALLRSSHDCICCCRAGSRLSEAWRNDRADTVPLPRYHFDVDLNYRVHRLDTVQQVTLPNTFGESISEVVFNVPAAHTRGVFDLHSVEVEAEDAAHTLDQTTLTVKLPRDLKPGEVITLTLKYTVRVPELNEPQSFGDANLAYTDDAMSIGYWYPMLAPYRSGAGWYATDWQSIGDPFVSEVADYTAVITTTPDVTVVAGGDLVAHGKCVALRSAARAHLRDDRQHTTIRRCRCRSAVSLIPFTPCHGMRPSPRSR